MPDLDHILYPAIEPYDYGWLAAPPNHEIYFEQCGNPDGKPVIVLHGGPGSGCAPGQRRFFDPEHYRIILFDQRGCNRSRPLGCTEANTTWHLVDDIEAIRAHLGIREWLVFGGSWGSTLALAYATQYAQAVSGLVLRGIFLCREQELDWFLRQTRHFFPEAWERLMTPVPKADQNDIMGWYYRQVFGEDRQSALLAAQNWNAYESEIMSLLPAAAGSAPPVPAISMARARVQLHYLVNLGFLAERPLLDQIGPLRNIPATIVQGRYDMVCPPVTAYELHAHWPEATLKMIPDAGHSAMEPGTAAALIEATDAFRHRA